MKILPFAALSIVELRAHCCVSMCPKVNHLGDLLIISELLGFAPNGSSESSCSSRSGSLIALRPTS